MKEQISADVIEALEAAKTGFETKISDDFIDKLRKEKKPVDGQFKLSTLLISREEMANFEGHKKIIGTKVEQIDEGKGKEKVEED
jgi:hypothetical protein